VEEFRYEKPSILILRRRIGRYDTKAIAVRITMEVGMIGHNKGRFQTPVSDWSLGKANEWLTRTGVSLV
jgi:hypothetical protein